MPAHAQTLKEIAVEFLTMAATGKVREAFERHAAPNFRHHNAYFPGDAASLRAGMEANARENPGKQLEVFRVLQDRDQVAVLSRVRHNPTERGYALVHIFRFELERIAEMWDVAQESPDRSPNANGMF